MPETYDVGFVHVGDPDAIDEQRHWVCADNCPHPDHESDEPRHSGSSDGEVARG